MPSGRCGSVSAAGHSQTAKAASTAAFAYNEKRGAGGQYRGKARRQQVKAAVRADKQREQAEKSGNRTRRTFDRGGR